VLSNENQIFELAWGVQPEIVVTYEIPRGSKVHSLWVHSWLIVVHLTDPSALAGQAAAPYSTTYVLNRNAGNSYRNAVAAIPHYDSLTFINFHKNNSHLVVIDSQGTSSYLLFSGRLEVYLFRPVTYK
jgi:hypothetical protein